VTKQQMHDQVKYWIGLQDIASFDETNFIDDLLYQGTLDLLARTRCVARCVNLNVLADVDTYTLDQLILALVDIEDGHRNRARRDEQAQNAYYPEFTLIRSDVLRLDPAPSENGSVQTWAVLKPAKMTADANSPSDEAYGAIPEEWHDAIVLYALWKGSDYSDDQSAQMGERYRALYEGQDGRGGRLAQIRIAVNKRGTARAPGRRVRLRGASPRGAWVG